MPTTPNYGWDVPADTDLVKNGAAAIRTLGNSADATMATMVPRTLVDAKGDLIAATAADTVARLGVGSNGQILRANSATATGLEWATLSAGAYTQLATASPTGVNTVTISGLNFAAYKGMWVQWQGLRIATGFGNNLIYMRFNGLTGSFYQYANPIAGDTYANVTSAAQFPVGLATESVNNTANGELSCWFAGVGATKKVFQGSFDEGDSGRVFNGQYNNNTGGRDAVTSLTFFTHAGGNFTSGSITVFGIN